MIRRKTQSNDENHEMSDSTKTTQKHTVVQLAGLLRIQADLKEP